MRKVNIEDISIRRLISILFVIGFVYALPAYNKFWAPFDEGMALVCTDMLKHGGIPYKDFVTPFGAIQNYLLAGIFYIFGTRIEVAHLYVIFLHAVITSAVFYLTYRLTSDRKVSIVMWMVSVSCLAPRIGVMVTSIWPFMFFSILGVVYCVWYIDRRRNFDLIMAGLFAGATILSRFELGLFLVVSQGLVVLL